MLYTSSIHHCSKCILCHKPNVRWSLTLFRMVLRVIDKFINNKYPAFTIQLFRYCLIHKILRYQIRFSNKCPFAVLDFILLLASKKKTFVALLS